MQSDVQQQITRSLLGRCLIKDQFSHIYCLGLIVCSNEIQMGKAKDDNSTTEEWVGHWPATSNVGRCESIGLLAGCWCESSGIGLRRGLYKYKPAKTHKHMKRLWGHPLREVWDTCTFWKTYMVCRITEPQWNLIVADLTACCGQQTWGNPLLWCIHW